MTTTWRRYGAAVLVGFSIANSITWIWLFYRYVDRCPTEPDRAHGFVYRLNNHGSHHYLRAAEAMGIHLVGQVFMLLFLAIVIVMPKNRVIRKKTGGAKGYEIEQFQLSGSETVLLWSAASAYVGMVVLLGNSAVKFALDVGMAP